MFGLPKPTLIAILITLQIVVAEPTTQAQSAVKSVPHWIWHPSEKNAPANALFEKEVQVEAPIQSARLRVAADSCYLKLSINGHATVSTEPFSPIVDVDVTNFIVLGKNTLRVEATKVPGPTAFAMSLQLNSADEAQSTTIVTDDNWRLVEPSLPEKKLPSVSLGLVSAALWGIGRRDIQLDAVENYEQWQQAKSGSTSPEQKFWTAPGFEISLLRNAQPDEGSWVSMAFDKQGRLTIAKEEKGLLRFTLDDQRTKVEKVEQLLGELLECRGMAYHNGALYLNANNSKGMYRVRDTNGDDQPDEVQLLREFPGGVGHGRNDLAVSYDSWIYSIHGDSVDIPRENIVDRTSPLRDTRAAGRSLPEGSLLRTDTSGRTWELLAAGMRNPFGVAENADGEWFTYDADAEHDMGSPWYRPTRVIHLVSGADFGWRGVTGRWPPYFPDHADNSMPTLDIGKGSPTAVLFGTHSHFPSDYQRALFILDWTYGRILALHLVPRGAGYLAQAETFLQGRPLNVTDLAIGLDGAMYVITGGRKTQSALYRIQYNEDLPSEPTSTQHELDAAANAVVARQLRKKLELGHAGQVSTDQSLALAWQHLDSDDSSIRYAARIAIEHQPPQKWQQQALQETRTLASIEAMLALVRSGDSSIAPAVLAQLLKLPTDKLTLTEVWGVLRLYSLLLDLDASTVRANRSEAIAQLQSLYWTLSTKELQSCRCGTNAGARREAAQLLAQLEADTIVETVSASLLNSNVQEDQLQGLFVLRNVRHGWTLANRETYFRMLNNGQNFIAGEGMPKFLSTIRTEAIATLTEHEKEQLAKLLEPSVNELEPLPQQRPLVRQWSAKELADLISQSTYQPDATRGATVFRDALCSRCHRSGARGPAVGPDLTHVGNRFSRRDLIESIVEPSKVVAENYRSLQVVTNDGRTFIGRAILEGDYRSQILRLNTDPLKPNEVVELDKREIESSRESPLSPMPAGLLDSFTAEEVLDLLKYLVDRDK